MNRGAATLWMMIAVIAVIGFLFWLNWKTDTLDSQVAATLDEEASGSEVVSITTLDLEGDPEAVVGQNIMLEFVPVAQRLGRGAFAINLAMEGTYPVLMSPDIIARGTEVVQGDQLTLFGHVFTFNDSIGAEWVSQGAVDEGNAGAIPDMPSFLLLDSLKAN
jgi:hypothetical protein